MCSRFNRAQLHLNITALIKAISETKKITLLLFLFTEEQLLGAVGRSVDFVTVPDGTSQVRAPTCPWVFFDAPTTLYGMNWISYSVLISPHRLFDYEVRQYKLNGCLILYLFKINI